MEKDFTKEQKRILRVLRRKVKELLRAPSHSERRIYVRDAKGALSPVRKSLKAGVRCRA